MTPKSLRVIMIEGDAAIEFEVPAGKFWRFKHIIGGGRSGIKVFTKTKNGSVSSGGSKVPNDIVLDAQELIGLSNTDFEFTDAAIVLDGGTIRFQEQISSDSGTTNDDDAVVLVVGVEGSTTA